MIKNEYFECVDGETIPKIASNEQSNLGVKSMWAHAKFNHSAPLVMFVTSCKTMFNRSNSALQIVSNTYKCRGNVNLTAIDTVNYVDTFYSWSGVGRAMGKPDSTNAVDALQENNHT